MKQVKRYKEYFDLTDPYVRDQIIKQIGYNPNENSYTLLIGNADERQEHLELLDELKKDFELESIQLITYNDLLNDYINLCNKIQEIYNIF